MSLTMSRSTSSSMPTSSMQRSSNGAIRATRPTYNASRSGYTGASSSSNYGSSGISRTVPRTLPNGPGPLPSRITVDKTNHRYVAQSSHRTSNSHDHRHSKPSTEDSSGNQRKSSRDSGYGSSSNVNSRTYGHSSDHLSYGELNGRRSKSLSQLSRKDETSSDISPYYRTERTDQYSHGVTRNSLSSHTVPKQSSSYRTTTQIDYRDHAVEAKQVAKSSSTVKGTDRDFTMGYSLTKKNSYSLIDLDKTGKKTITALPTELKMARKSSYSSSNCSSTSNSPTGRGSSDGLVGLRNLGNTCFMNSILQCLSHTWPLTDQLLKGSHTHNINMKSSMKGKLIQAFVDLIKSMWKPGNSDSAVSPHSFKTQIQRFAPRFVGYNQQDAQEFLRFFLEGLHDDLNQVRDKPKYTAGEYDDSLSDQQKAEKSWMTYLSRDKSLMTDLFVGQLKSMLKCCSCGYTSVTFDPFWDLSLPIPRKSGHGSTSSPWSDRRSTGSDDSDIRDCIQTFTKEEVLDGDERPTCDKCKVKRKSTKKFSIQRFPPILVLHLKRFSGFSFRSKLQTNVDFPLSKLDLGEFAADPQDSRSAAYSLYAVSNHSGSTYGGHYTAYCKHPISNEWHCFNDSRVDGLSSTRVGGSQAYILFYEKTEHKSSL